MANLPPPSQAPSTYVRRPMVNPRVIDAASYEVGPASAPVAAAPVAAAGVSPLAALAAIAASGAIAREGSIAATGGRKVFNTEAEREAAKPKNVRNYLAKGTASPETIKRLETEDPIAAAQLKQINKPSQTKINPMGKIIETIGNAMPGFAGNVVRPSNAAATDTVTTTPVVNPPTTPSGTAPAAPVKGDLMSGLKDFFIDKERGGLSMPGLLTLGALARVVTGAREGSAGMKGGGMESANLGAFMKGATEGVVAKNEAFDKNKLERDKLASAERAAKEKAATTAAAKTPEQDKYARSMILGQMARPDWATDSKLQSQVSPEHNTETGDNLRYWYLNENYGPYVADYFLRMGSNSAINPASKLPPGVTVTPG